MADISKIAKEMARAYDKSEITMHGSSLTLPDKEEIISILGDIKKRMFPAYFAAGEAKGDAITFCEPLLYSIYGRIKKQISLALSFKEKDVGDKANEIAERFISALPGIHALLLTDVDASFEGDPAAQSKEEIVFSYPGFNAIFVY